MTTFHRIQVKDCNIFYREAGNPENSTILLLHGFPLASHMFRELIPELADKYHLIAPDMPSFGQTECPSREHQPRFLAVWGKNDPSFIPAGTEAFKRDLPNAVVKFVDSGHFALESHHSEIAGYIKAFLL